MGSVVLALVRTNEGLDELIQSMILTLLAVSALRAVMDAIHVFIASILKDKSVPQPAPLSSHAVQLV